MKAFNIHEAKTNFSSLVAMVALGEEIVISKAGEPVAVLVPYKKKGSSKERKPGLFQGQISLSKDFFDPLDDEFMKHFS